MDVRDYTAGDARATSLIFVRAVSETARAHYSPVQVAAWAAEGADLDSWAVARAAAHTRVAVVDEQLVGFVDLKDDGYIDMLFVDPAFGRRGIGSALLESVIALAQQRGIPMLSTFASLTSQPVFERHGFVITGERFFGEGEEASKTYTMSRVLNPSVEPIRSRAR